MKNSLIKRLNNVIEESQIHSSNSESDLYKNVLKFSIFSGWFQISNNERTELLKMWTKSDILLHRILYNALHILTKKRMNVKVDTKTKTIMCVIFLLCFCLFLYLTLPDMRIYFQCQMSLEYHMTECITYNKCYPCMFGVQCF